MDRLLPRRAVPDQQTLGCSACRRRCPCPVDREGDYECASGLSAEGQSPAATAGAALHTAAEPRGWAGDEPHALMPEDHGGIWRHGADRREALAHQCRSRGAGLGGGSDHLGLLSGLPQGGLICRAIQQAGGDCLVIAPDEPLAFLRKPDLEPNHLSGIGCDPEVTACLPAPQLVRSSRRA